MLTRGSRAHSRRLFGTIQHQPHALGSILMFNRLWRRLIKPSVMRDADRLIAAHGRGAYGMARLGARAAKEAEGVGHWSSVAAEIARRLELELAPEAPEHENRNG